MPRPHIDEDTLERYLLGTVPAGLIPEVEEHLLFCSACQTTLVETEEFISAFRLAAEQVQPTSKWGWFSPIRSAVWAGAASAVAATLILFAAGSPRNVKISPAVVLMHALRGPEDGAQVASGKPSLLVFDLPLAAIPNAYRVEIVDLTGAVVVEKDGEIRDGRFAVSLEKLASGSYWVRVYRKSDRDELIAEYALRAR